MTDILNAIKNEIKNAIDKDDFKTVDFLCKQWKEIKDYRKPVVIASENMYSTFKINDKYDTISFYGAESQSNSSDVIKFN